MLSNIFLGLGGFNIEKIVIACCGTYFLSAGKENVFVEHEMCSPGVIKSFISRSKNILGKKDMVILAETLQRLQLDAFPSSRHDAL